MLSFFVTLNMFKILGIKWLFCLIYFLATYYCFTEYKRLADLDNSSFSLTFTTNLSTYKDKKETWAVLGECFNENPENDIITI